MASHNTPETSARNSSRSNQSSPTPRVVSPPRLTEGAQPSFQAGVPLHPRNDVAAPDTELSITEQTQSEVSLSQSTVSGLHGEQRVYNKTADPPRQVVDEDAHGRRIFPAGLLQATTTSDDGASHSHTLGRVDDFWAEQARDVDDPTSLVINERFQFISISESELQTPGRSNRTIRKQLAPGTESTRAPRFPDRVLLRAQTM